MGGRASLILVIGFAVIFGYINLNLARLSSTSVESMVGYNEIAVSRNMASAGANAGLAVLTYKQYPHTNRVLSSRSFTTGPFARSSYIVRIDSFSNPKPYLLLQSVSSCTTYLFKDAAKTVPYILNDTVEVRFDYDKKYSFSSFGWMSINENGVYFTKGDTLWGRVHSNGTINIDQNPVFWGKVTTSQLFNPSNNSGVFKAGKETGVAEHPFPDDLSEAQTNATNKTSGIDAGHTNTRTSELWVELKPGTSADNDGYAIIRIGSYAGTKVDSIPLSGLSDNVIYSTQDIHVKGTLDGRLSIASGDDIKIEGNTVYEKPPDIYNNDPGLSLDPPSLTLSQNQTKDMLGLIANDDVIIPSNYHGDITIDASIFARSGSFMAENWNQSSEGRINIVGSVSQQTRGAVGQTNGNGYKKSYRFDPRFSDQLSEDPDMHPPSFPSYSQPSNVAIRNWWESPRVPLDVKSLF